MPNLRSLIKRVDQNRREEIEKLISGTSPNQKEGAKILETLKQCLDRRYLI